MATTTITTTGAQDARLAPAFGALLHLSGNANAAQIKQWIVEQLRGVVQEYEDRQQKSAHTVTPFDPT